MKIFNDGAAWASIVCLFSSVRRILQASSMLTYVFTEAALFHDIRGEMLHYETLLTGWERTYLNPRPSLRDILGMGFLKPASVRMPPVNQL